jgi:hypothetical protein
LRNGQYALQYFLANDERMHHYQRRRTSITGVMVELRKIIETGRLVEVIMRRLVLLFDSLLLGSKLGIEILLKATNSQRRSETSQPHEATSTVEIRE